MYAPADSFDREENPRRNLVLAAGKVALEAVVSPMGTLAADRSAAIRARSSTCSAPCDFSRPGRIFPLRATTSGVPSQAGYTGSTADPCQLAGLTPAGALVVRSVWLTGAVFGSRCCCRGVQPQTPARRMISAGTRVRQCCTDLADTESPPDPPQDRYPSGAGPGRRRLPAHQHPPRPLPAGSEDLI
ncbi:3,4-dihydroxy-2-butanone-4-phosphate synthase [Streptomyces sp. NPDC047081]|uniref:3,4-dihydroxy-2-butanone-4-phosphate synthase n=1 Tax=Streptomyces sp. NPDC047081 TaxID=3154706 RepID=UPI0033CC885F